FPTGSHSTGYEIDGSSLTGFNQFTLGGAGYGTSWAVDHNYAAGVLADGFTVCYHLTGIVGTGAVTATFTADNWNVVPTAGGSSAATDVDMTSPVQRTASFSGVAAIDGSSLTGTGVTLAGAGYGTAWSIDSTYAPVVLGD